MDGMFSFNYSLDSWCFMFTRILNGFMWDIFWAGSHGAWQTLGRFLKIVDVTFFISIWTVRYRWVNGWMNKWVVLVFLCQLPWRNVRIGYNCKSNYGYLLYLITNVYSKLFGSKRRYAGIWWISYLDWHIDVAHVLCVCQYSRKYVQLWWDYHVGVDITNCRYGVSLC